MIAVYVSGHGFGHATRTAEVLRALRARAPGLPVHVMTSAPSFLFEGIVAPPLAVRHLECDVGLVQKDALLVDEAETAARWRAFAAGWDRLVGDEASWMRAEGVGLVLADIPPSAFAAAAAAKVPAVALGNFSWDWIYQHLAPRQPALGEAAAAARSAYAQATLLLRLPFAGDLGAFPQVEDVPLVARRPRVARDGVRSRLDLGEGPTVLLSFGGAGLPGLRIESYGALPEYRFVLTGPSGEGAVPPNVTRLASGEVEKKGLDYPDLVGAVDVVVTKPGYGIVTDCIGAGTRIVYTDRGDFPEYPILSREMTRYIPAVHVGNDDVRHGRLGSALSEVRGLPVPEPPPLDGAEVAADRLLSLVGA
jgi:L-arabinokinase